MIPPIFVTPDTSSCVWILGLSATIASGERGDPAFMPQRSYSTLAFRRRLSSLPCRRLSSLLPLKKAGTEDGTQGLRLKLFVVWLVIAIPDAKSSVLLRSCKPLEANVVDMAVTEKHVEAATMAPIQSTPGFVKEKSVADRKRTSSKRARSIGDLPTPRLEAVAVKALRLSFF